MMQRTMAILTGTAALTRLTWSSWLAQRSFFFLLAFGWMITPLIYLFVWATVAAEGAVGGITQDDFIAYYLILIVVNQFTFATANWTVGDAIHEGVMNTVLLRPLPPIADAIANELAGKGVFLLFDVPLVIGLALLLRPDITLTVGGLLAFIPALLLGALLRFLVGYSLALLAFWSTRADALLALHDSLIFLLGGVVAPAALLPDLIQSAALALPFRYMVGFPVEVLLGTGSNPGIGDDLWIGFVVQAAWVMLAVLAARMMWRAGLRRYEAVGG